jgi:hypothetical protein
MAQPSSLQRCRRAHRCELQPADPKENSDARCRRADSRRPERPLPLRLWCADRNCWIEHRRRLADNPAALPSAANAATYFDPAFRMVVPNAQIRAFGARAEISGRYWSTVSPSATRQQLWPTGHHSKDNAGHQRRLHRQGAIMQNARAALSAFSWR